MSKLESIDHATLATVTGAGVSTFMAQMHMQLPNKNSAASSLTTSKSVATTDYQACTQAVSRMGGTATDVASACGPTQLQ